MRILPYSRKFFGAHAQEAERDWTQQEMADFYRAHRLLVQNGVGIGMDRGIADDGDPWLAFFDLATQDVFLHVARIDQRCILVCDQLDLRITSASISELIATFEAEVCRIVSVRQEKAGNVILHPAARIIMSISAVFLLFKLENSTAHAKSADADFAGSNDTTRKQEMSLAGRAQSVLARLYDIVDTPAAVASLAGILLSLEIASLNARSEHTGNLELSLLSEPEIHHHQTLHPVPAELVLDGVDAENLATTQPVIAEGDVIAPEVAAVPIPIQIEVNIAPVVSTRDNVITFTTVERADIPPLTNDEQNVVVVASVQSTPVDDGPAAADGKKSDAPTVDSLALEALKAIMDVDGVMVPSTSDENASVGEITLATLDTLIPKLGVVEQVELSGQDLSNVLSYFRSVFQGVEIEFTGSYVLMEQHNASSMKNAELGLWQNVMADGSAILIVGHIDFIDAATSMFG